jgi:hypothetical protein
MFWTRFWLLLVTVACAAAVSFALLAPRPVQQQLERESGARLERAQQAAALLLKVNARKWMDTVAQVATDAMLVESLEQATRGPADLNLLHRTVQERLRYFNVNLKQDIIIATDAKGRVVARAGLDENVYKDGVEGFPLVADALRGLRGDDSWSIGGKLYRVEASPVIARDRYVGALILGQEVGSELATSMKQVLDVDVAFLLRGRVLASTAQSALLERLPQALTDHGSELESMGRSAPFALRSGGESHLVVVAPFVGEAAAHKAAYALFAPSQSQPSLGELAGKLLGSDFKTLPWLLLAPIGGALVLAWIIGLLLVRLEADRPVRRMAREAQALARGDVARLDDHVYPGRLGTVARAINAALERLGPRGRRGEGESAGVPPWAEVASGGRASTEPPMSASPSPPMMRDSRRELEPLPLTKETMREPSPPPPRREPSPPPLRRDSSPPLRRDPSPPPFGARGSTEPPSPPPPPSLVRDVPPPMRDVPPPVRDVPPPPLMRDVPPPPIRDTSPPRPVVEVEPADEDSGLDRPTSRLRPSADRLGMDYVDAPAVLAPLPQTSVGGPTGIRNFDDEPTMASPNAARVMARPTASDTEPNTMPRQKLSPEDEALELELKQVYLDFVETKQRCGEPIESLTFDKFVVKLKSNRAQLITRYSCKAVRFQVYIKDGKAALKATPVT